MYLMLMLRIKLFRCNLFMAFDVKNSKTYSLGLDQHWLLLIIRCVSKYFISVSCWYFSMLVFNDLLVLLPFNMFCIIFMLCVTCLVNKLLQYKTNVIKNLSMSEPWHWFINLKKLKVFFPANFCTMANNMPRNLIG